MSRHRDYQPTIDRARSQAEIAQRREAKIREKKDECHREMLRAVAAARIANEEADALRDRITGLEQSVRDLRNYNARMRQQNESDAAFISGLYRDLEAAQHPWRTRFLRLKAWVGERWREMLVAGAAA